MYLLLGLWGCDFSNVDSGPDDDEVVTLWVDPIDEFSMPVIDGVATDLLNRGGGKITDVSIRGDQMLGQPAFFDNLRVGTSFSAVAHGADVPLPGDFDADGDLDAEFDSGDLVAVFGRRF